MKKFYCKKVCGDPNFSIDDWNRLNKFCNDAGIEGIERDKLLHTALFPCKVQCDECINIVLDTRKKNAEIRAKQAKNISFTIKNTSHANNQNYTSPAKHNYVRIGIYKGTAKRSSGSNRKGS